MEDDPAERISEKSMSPPNKAYKAMKKNIYIHVKKKKKKLRYETKLRCLSVDAFFSILLLLSFSESSSLKHFVFT